MLRLKCHGLSLLTGGWISVQVFYLTSSYEQAARWAELTALRRNAGEKTITAFEYDEALAQSMKKLVFSAPDAEWLRYAVNNRTNENAADDYDIVIGPVANDRSSPALAVHFAGIYTEEKAINRLLSQKLKDQYAFKTEKALTALTLKEVIRL